jgi:hypothetical protein
MIESLPIPLRALLVGFVKADMDRAEAIAAALVAIGEGDNIARVAREYALDRSNLHRDVRQFREVAELALEHKIIDGLGIAA